MDSMLAERSVRCWHEPFQTQTRLQRCRPACKIRCEAVHRRHVALQLASRDLSVHNLLVDQDLAITADVQDHAALSRRSLALAAVALGLSTPFRALAETATATQRKNLTEYVNSKQGYVLDRPTSWEQTSKAGADVLFTDPQKKSTTVGVTVNPIKIAGLEQFGDVETVRKKLVDTEKQKESTKGVMLISESSRKGKKGTLIYDIEYELDSTRGRKRILSTVAIAQKKLFIVNGNMKCDPAGCNEDSTDLAVLRQIAGTFDVIV